MVTVAEGQIPKVEPARIFCKCLVLLPLPRVRNNLASAFDIPAEREQNLLLVSGLV